MRFFLNKRFSIFFALTISFFIVIYFFSDVFSPKQIFLIKKKFKNFFVFGEKEFKNIIFVLKDNFLLSSKKKEVVFSTNIKSEKFFYYLPTLSISKKPTVFPITLSPTIYNPSSYFFSDFDQQFGQSLFENKWENKDNLTISKSNPQPTFTPKPTKTPKPTPTLVAPIEFIRPGNSLEDIFKKASEATCIPVSLFKAFIAQEAPGILKWTDEQALFYNAYDWWHRVKSLKEVCRGYGWHPETGLVAEDSLFAGERCKQPFSEKTANDIYSQSLGAFQFLKVEWQKIENEVKRVVKKDKVDRRVLYDSLIGFSIYLKKNMRYTPKNCSDWEFKDVAVAACIQTGGHCDYYNYCYTICNNYNKFANKNYPCGNINNLFVSGGFCQVK